MDCNTTLQSIGCHQLSLSFLYARSRAIETHHHEYKNSCTARRKRYLATHGGEIGWFVRPHDCVVVHRPHHVDFADDQYLPTDLDSQAVVYQLQSQQTQRPSVRRGY